jgi:tRNA dimethylallyltransferase
MTNKKIIVILGPTATGKSKLAIKLAQEFRGEIVSADSRQVYKEMDIGTDKISKEEMEGIPHYLLDVIDPQERFNVVQYQKLATRTINNILARGKIPFLVGGSPFYIYSIVYGWQFPSIEINKKIRTTLQEKSSEELSKILFKLDRKRFKQIDKKNKRRIIRAIEIAQQLGTVPSRQSKALFNSLLIGIKVSFPELKIRINQRLKKHLWDGMIEEIKELRNQGISWERLDNFGLECRWISRYLRGEIDKKTMEAKLQKDIEHFAKKQMTWFKRDKNIHWINNFSEAKNLIATFL